MKDLSLSATLLIFSLLLIAVCGIPGCTPQSELSATELAAFKSALEAEGVSGGCACINKCNFLNNPNGEAADCYDEEPLREVTIADPQNNNQPTLVAIGCYCVCGATGSMPCEWDDEKVSWPSPVNEEEDEPGI